MAHRFGVVLVLVLSSVLMLSDARLYEVSEVVVMQIEDDALVTEIENPKLSLQNEKLCSLCEQFTSQAVEYLKQNKTQAEIIHSLHQACSQLHSLEQQCLLLVDYYAPLFFMEVDLISPEKFCKKVNLCEKTEYVFQGRTGETCTVCQQALVEILLKLKNPETQLEVVEALLKSCSKMENFAQQCKKLVFEYGPIIFENAEKFLETTDICTYIHACKASEELATTQERHSHVAISDI